MKPRHKSAPVEFKAEGDQGAFSALVSVFNNVDLVGDRVMPGAFKKTLKEWRKGGDPIPVVFNHDWATPDAHIGVADPRAVLETDKGLLVQGKLDIEDNPVAKQVYKLLKRRSLKGFSFGYTVPDDGESLADDGANELTEIDLVEIGPTLKGANPEAQLQEVKSALDVEAPAPIPVTFTDVTTGNTAVGADTTITWDATAPVVTTAGTTNTNLDVEEPPAERVEVPVSDELLGDAEQVREYLKNHPDFEVPEGFKVVPLSEFKPTDEPPLTGEALEKAIEESDRFRAYVAAGVEAMLKEERKQADWLEFGWDGSPSRFSDPQWAAACALDQADGGDVGEMPAKERFALPFKGPGAVSPDRGGLRAAARHFFGFSASPAVKKGAAERLVNAFEETKAEPPDALLEAAGRQKTLLVPEQEVENVESEKPAQPVTPAAKDALKNEIDLLRLEIAVGKPLRG